MKIVFKIVSAVIMLGAVTSCGKVDADNDFGNQDDRPTRRMIANYLVYDAENGRYVAAHDGPQAEKTIESLGNDNSFLYRRLRQDHQIQNNSECGFSESDYEEEEETYYHRKKTKR